MNRQHVIIALVLLGLFSACSPKVSTSISKSHSPLPYQEEVVVIGLHQVQPENAEVLGQVKVGDTGFTTKCNYELVIEKAKLEARKAGGNALKLTRHKTPTAFGSSCHRIEANILKVEDVHSLELPAEEVDSAMLKKGYAILNVYRMEGPGFLINYDLHLGDTTICRVKNKWKQSIRIKKEGPVTLWARTEVKKEMPVNIQYGREYYVRCGITMGAFVGHPTLELVDYNSGKAEFEAIPWNTKDKRDRLVFKDGAILDGILKKEDDHNVYFTVFEEDKRVETSFSKDLIETIEKIR